MAVTTMPSLEEALSGISPKEYAILTDTDPKDRVLGVSGFVANYAA
ncbi:MAG TPA: hypothetical protein VKB49_03795 [Candidatus Sulfotelmatobacter sp.]|nr:hypothetical protein [Candidatus Sulfotelmatobacter sp.]